ncbi:MAG: hypothetical protein V7727_18695 [Sneathiella sp.]
MTPYLFGVLAKGHNKGRRVAFETAAWQAHTTATLMRAKKLPKLKEIIGAPKATGIDEDLLKQKVKEHNERVKHGSSS